LLLLVVVEEVEKTFKQVQVVAEEQVDFALP
jgi:hypothetical protein